MSSNWPSEYLISCKTNCGCEDSQSSERLTFNVLTRTWFVAAKRLPVILTVGKWGAISSPSNTRSQAIDRSLVLCKPAITQHENINFRRSYFSAINTNLNVWSQDSVHRASQCHKLMWKINWAKIVYSPRFDLVNPTQYWLLIHWMNIFRVFHIWTINSIIDQSACASTFYQVCRLVWPLQCPHCNTYATDW